MYCRHCGKEIEENMKFCPYCGRNISNDLQKANTIADFETSIGKETEDITITKPEMMEKRNEESSMVDTESSKILAFQKNKMIGNITYKHTETTVEFKINKIHIHQKIRKFFFLNRQKEEDIPLSSISFASIQTKMDFWDTLYGISFAIGGFYSPLFFLVATLFLYCGYGKVITLKMSNGSKFQIPLKGNIDDAKKLINYCR